MAINGGWTGKILRVNLSTGKISSEDTEKYTDFIGAQGLAYKILWDEVPTGTDPHSPENKIIFGAGPFNGTNIPSSGRLTITSLLALSPFAGVGSGHAGGQWSSELKFAGWDSLIVEGKAEKPVWICIQDDNVTIRDARMLWGNGIFRATAEICEEMGSDAHVLAIGQAGENLVRQSVMMCDRSHSAQGGSIMGSKNLKAIGVKGTGSVKIATDPKAWMELINYHTSMVGDENQGVVPKSPQPWAEYSGGDRWIARKGLFWGGADPQVETGECEPHDLNSISYRNGMQKFSAYKNKEFERLYVRGDGCFGCPLACHGHIHVPQMETKYGVSGYVANTCNGFSQGKEYYSGKFPDSMTQYEAQCLGNILCDDYGLGNDYHLLPGDFVYLYENGYLKENLSEEEYNSIPWELNEAGDPRFLFDILRRIAFREGELGDTLADGNYLMNKKWELPPEAQQQAERDPGKAVVWANNFAPHHFEGQVQGLINMMYNRDPTLHEVTKMYGSGLPLALAKGIVGEILGSGDALDEEGDWTPMNEYKAKFAVRALCDGELHNSLVMCNWSYPIWFSPLKERNYRGDSALTAKLYSALTGEETTEEEIVQTGKRLFTLFRALNIRSMGTMDMRNKHDIMPDSMFDHESWEGAEPFTPGTHRMDRADMELAKDLFYAELGWDKATGAPTRKAYEEVGLKDVADELEKMKLLPA